MLLVSCNAKEVDTVTQDIKKEIEYNDIVIPEIEIVISDSIFQFKNGILYYGEQLFSGVVVDYYDVNIIKSKKQYYKGKPHGYYNMWYPSGEKLSGRNYKNGFKVGVHYGWWGNGSQKFVYYFNDKGQHHGSLKEWYQNGKLYRYFNYTNGKEDGAQKAWKSDGRFKANYEVVNGQRYGLIGLKRCFTVNKGENKIKRG